MHLPGCRSRDGRHRVVARCSGAAAARLQVGRFSQSTVGALESHVLRSAIEYGNPRSRSFMLQTLQVNCKPCITSMIIDSMFQGFVLRAHRAKPQLLFKVALPQTPALPPLTRAAVRHSCAVQAARGAQRRGQDSDYAGAALRLPPQLVRAHFAAAARASARISRRRTHGSVIHREASGRGTGSVLSEFYILLVLGGGVVGAGV